MTPDKYLKDYLDRILPGVMQELYSRDVGMITAGFQTAMEFAKNELGLDLKQLAFERDNVASQTSSSDQSNSSSPNA